MNSSFRRNDIVDPNKPKGGGGSLKKNVIEGVVIAVIVGILGFAGNWATDGGIFKLVDYLSSKRRPFEVHKFGALGRIAADKGKDREFTAINSGAIIAQREAYPICMISMMGIVASKTSIASRLKGTCSIFINGQDDWEINVTDDASCKVMCFK